MIQEANDDLVANILTNDIGMLIRNINLHNIINDDNIYLADLGIFIHESTKSVYMYFIKVEENYLYNPDRKVYYYDLINEVITILRNSTFITHNNIPDTVYWYYNNEVWGVQETINRLFWINQNNVWTYLESETIRPVPYEIIRDFMCYIITKYLKDDTYKVDKTNFSAAFILQLIEEGIHTQQENIILDNTIFDLS